MESRWAELRLILPRRRFDLTSAHLFELGTVGIQEDLLPGELPRIQQPWDTGPPPAPPSRVLLRAWWPEDTALPEVQAAVAELIREWDDVDVPTWGEVADGDWAEAWRAAFHPIRVSERLVVSPPWEAGPGDLLIEPGMAFGTGEHPTTRACLAAVDRLAVPGETCVDLGMGTGVLALAAARVGMKARGVDIDPDSVRAARENAARNQLEAYFDDTWEWDGSTWTQIPGRGPTARTGHSMVFDQANGSLLLVQFEIHGITVPRSRSRGAPTPA